MMRIVHIISGLLTGGAERALARLLGGGLQGPIENHVISLGAHDTQAAAIEATGARVHLLQVTGLLATPAGLSRLAGLVRELRPNLLQGWMYHGNLATTAAATLSPGLPHCWNIRQSLDDPSGDKFLTRQIIRAARILSNRPQRIIYNSAVSAEQHAQSGFASQKVTVIPNGFETALVRPDPQTRERERARLAIPDEARLIVHIARHHPMKDHQGFLAAAAKSLQDGAPAYFVLAGRGVTSQNTGFQRLVPPKWHQRFRFLGEVDDTIPILQAADALVVSSRRAEGFPNVLGEAMMTGTACVTTDTGDCAAILGDAGLIVPPCDYAAMADAIRRLACDTDLATEFGARGNARVSARFDIKAVVERYLALYEALLQSGNKL
jgi:glycosyltransferase involved in cell wall biosynthesis